MPSSSTIRLALSAAALLAPATALAAPSLPPMNGFNSAYYVCDGGGQFSMSYGSAQPKVATMTTSNNSKTYSLKRTRVDPGVEFAGGPVKFWTDGTTTRVEGTEVALTGCKVQSN